jgi:hypothetical protein
MRRWQAQNAIRPIEAIARCMSPAASIDFPALFFKRQGISARVASNTYGRFSK